MDFEQETNIPHTSYQKKHSESMALAAMVLGMISLTACSCIYLSVVCGALGIILALLSKGGECEMNARARTGLALSSAGLILSIIAYTVSFFILLSQYGGIDGLLQEYMHFYNADTIEELYQILGL